ncbi:pfs domain-containing protein, partial [Histoplasma capsulatum]
PLQPSKQREQQPLIRSTLVQTPSQVMSSIMDRAKYTVGWIALLPLELAAAKGMLEGANTML